MKNSNLSEALGRVFTLENLIKFLILLSVLGLWVMMITGCTDAATTMLATVGVVTTTGGTHITGAPLTAKLTEEHAPSLLRSDIDNRLVKIRPSATPLDQISRMVGARMAKSMKVDYYSVDTKPGKSIVTSQKGGEMIDVGEAFTLSVRDPHIFAVSETVMFPDVKVNDGSGREEALVCYVKATSSTSLELLPVNIDTPDDVDSVSLPLIGRDTEIVRMGRAAGELDVQTTQYASLPRKAFNYCQIFKTQIEESTYQRLADKEVGWTFSDQEEVAVIDMRLGMEKSFLFGSRRRLTISAESGEEVLLTGGIWNQAGRDFTYDPAAFGNPQMIALMRHAFAEGAGSPRKILLAGSSLVECLNNLDNTRILSATDKETIWGVDFHRMVSKFGSLYVIHSEVFDLCGKPGCGLVIDPEYVTKYTHVPFSADRISFRKQGVRNTEAVVLTEASCLVLRYPDAHMRITPTA